MAKAPVMGRVKTRLARQVGAVDAVRFYRNAIGTVVRRLSRDTRWRTILAVSPDTSTASRCWPHRTRCLAQGNGDLGRRMQRLLELPHAGRVVLIGTDIPAVRPAHVARAFALLGNKDVVLGPAADGGFWLAGMRSCPKPHRPFAGVRWSHPETLADTMRNLESARVELADTLSDVDTAEDLCRYATAAARLVPQA